MRVERGKARPGGGARRGVTRSHQKANPTGRATRRRPTSPGKCHQRNQGQKAGSMTYTAGNATARRRCITVVAYNGMWVQSASAMVGSPGLPIHPLQAKSSHKPTLPKRMHQEPPTQATHTDAYPTPRPHVPQRTSPTRQNNGRAHPAQEHAPRGHITRHQTKPMH